MSTTRMACNPRLIDEFISDQLNATKLQQLEEHLNVCELCQSRFNEQLSTLEINASLPHLRFDGVIQSETEDGSNKEEVLRSFAAKFFPVRDGEDFLGRIHQFELVEPIGSGGMGLVYKAFDQPLNRYVALKVLSPAIATTGAAKQRFIREAQAAAAIHSPYVVPIYAVSEVDGLPYIVMRFESGVNLQEHLNAQGPLRIHDALKIAYQIAVGLVAAHQQSVIHRDVKPANILLEPSVLHASLTDFGLALVANDASLTHSGMTPGTPSFMSPEQASGSTIDNRSDWYSLGCVLYTMLVGHPPFRGQHAFEVLSRLQKEEPKKPSHYRPEVSPWLDRLVMMLLAKRPEDRLSDGKQIVNWLNTCALHLENPNEHDLPKELTSRKQVRSLVWVFLVLAIFGGSIYRLIPTSAPATPKAPPMPTTINSMPTEMEPTQEELVATARMQVERLKMKNESDWNPFHQLQADIEAKEVELGW